MPITDRLTNALNAVVEDLVILCESLDVRYVNYSSHGLFVVAPDHHWSERTSSQQHEHLGLMRRYRQVAELISVLIKGAPPDLAQQLEDADKEFLTWLELGSNWSLTSNKKSNETEMRKAADGLHAVVSVLAAGRRDKLVLIPDTNSLIASADPIAYRSISAGRAFEFVLLPTVLAELDQLKILHRNQDVREKAKKVITRIKGWRAQGPLLNGVVVDKTIRVRAVHAEPKIAESLSWLDADNADDRIVASVLQLQSAFPSDHVILVTGDINLQNKADAAMIETTEIEIDNEN